MANSSYDTLTIKINADSKQANSSIRSLSNNLNKLNETAKQLDVERLQQVKEFLLDIANIDFSNVSKGLQDVVSAFRYFQNRTAQKISPVFSAFGKGNEISELDKGISSYVSNLEEANFEFSRLGQVSSINTSKMDRNVESATKGLGKLRKEVEKLEEDTKRVSNQFAKMFKNILKYRVVRRIIQEIFKEIETAIENLAELDPDFNKAFGEIVSAFSYVSRVLVSVIAPVIKAIAPLFTMIAEAFGEIMTTFGSTLAGALGQQEFYEATENVETYTESLKKAKNVAMGFDKLNVIQQDNGEGFKLTEANQVSNVLSNAFQNLTNKLKALFGELKPQLESLAVSLVNLLIKCEPLLEVIVDLTYDLIHYTDDGVNNSLTATIELLGETIHLIGNVATILKPILKYFNFLVIGLINITNWTILWFSYAKSIMLAIKNALGDTFLAVLKGDFLEVGRIWSNLFDSMYKKAELVVISIGNYLIKIWNGVITIIENSVNTLINAFNNIASVLHLPTIPSVDFSGVKGNYMTSSYSTPTAPQTNNYEQSQQKEQQIVINLDGREIARVVNKQNANMGSRMFMGGAINYGK